MSMKRSRLRQHGDGVVTKAVAVGIDGEIDGGVHGERMIHHPENVFVQKRLKPGEIEIGRVPDKWRDFFRP
jgi:hypothetical protein